jgi:hypothetical protein
MRLFPLLAAALAVLIVSGCTYNYTFEQGMSELESIEGRYLDPSGSVVRGSLKGLASELEVFKARIDSQAETGEMRALSIFTDFKISYYLLLDGLSQASAEASCSNPSVIDDLVDSAGSVRYHSERISDAIQTLIDEYSQFMGNETLSDMQILRESITESTELLMGSVDERIQALSACQEG